MKKKTIENVVTVALVVISFSLLAAAICLAFRG